MLFITKVIVVTESNHVIATLSFF